MWVMAGVVGLLVVAVVVVFALQLTRPDDQPTAGPTTETDGPDGAVIGLETDAELDPDLTDMTLEPPAGFTVADDDPDFPRWDSGPYCYIGLSQYALDDDNRSDADATASAQGHVLEFYERERLDMSVLVDDGRATLSLDDGRLLEAHVVEFEFRRTDSDPLLWSSFVIRDMPGSGFGLSVNYSCELDADRPSLDEVLAAVTIVTNGENSGDGATTGTGALTDPTWPTDRPILLTDQAPFLASSVGIDLTPPEGFAHVDGDEEHRWSRTPECFIAVDVVSIDAVDDSAIPDAFMTDRFIDDVVELYEEMLSDVNVLQHGQRVTLPVTTGHQVELALLDVTYALEADEPLVAESTLVRTMPQIATQIALTYRCPVDQQPIALADVLATVTVTP